MPRPSPRRCSRQAGRGGPARRGRDHRGPHVGPLLGRALRDRADHPDPLDPRAQRRGDPRTPAGTVLHTGDWKLDPDPLVGDDYDEARLRGRWPRKASWPWSATPPTPWSRATGSEAEVRDGPDGADRRPEEPGRGGLLRQQRRALRDHRSSAAQAHGRRVALVGRSMHRIFKAARDTGYLNRCRRWSPRRRSATCRADEVLLLCTGSQGEPRAALASASPGTSIRTWSWRRATRSSSPRASFRETRRDLRLHNALSRQGDRGGHRQGPFRATSPAIRRREELSPDVSVGAAAGGDPGPRRGPPPGRARRLAPPARCPDTIVAENGDLIRLAPGRAEVVEQVQTGRLALDGSRPDAAGRRVGPRARAWPTTARPWRPWCWTATVACSDEPPGDHDPGPAQRGTRSCWPVSWSADPGRAGGLGRGDRATTPTVGEAARTRPAPRAYRTKGKRPVTDVHVHGASIDSRAARHCTDLSVEPPARRGRS